MTSPLGHRIEQYGVCTKADLWRKRGGHARSVPRGQPYTFFLMIGIQTVPELALRVIIPTS